MDNTRPLYDRKALRDVLRVSEATLWRMVKDGRIEPPMKVCGLDRWAPDYVDQLIGRNPSDEAA